MNRRMKSTKENAFMDSDAFFAQNSLFAGTDWYAFRRVHGDAAESSAEQLLRYYVAKKRIVKVRKGLYAVVQPGTEPERFCYRGGVLGGCAGRFAATKSLGGEEYNE